MSTPTKVVQAMYQAYEEGDINALKNTLSEDISWHKRDRTCRKI